MPALKGQLLVAQFLVANGAEWKLKTRNIETPLHRAALQGHKGDC